jgi:hypothetical protein
MNKGRIWRVVLSAGLVVVILWTASVFVLYRVMHRPPEDFARVMSKLTDAAFLVFPFQTMWMHARSGALELGASAPDFSLMKLDHSGRVQLSSLVAQQPVVLIFGSYT